MRKCNNVTIKLKIADIIIQMQSCFPLEKLTEEEGAERFKNFFCEGRQRPDIVIKVEIVNRLPESTKAKPVFITYHFQDGSENWCLLKRDNTYIYKNLLEDKKQLVMVNKTFDRVTAYLLPKRDKGRVWNVSDIIYDFLQVLLINYLAVIKKDGIFTHAMGIKDISKYGLLFAGKSKSGKTTLAKLYHKHSKALVLNDDRIIVRKINPVRKGFSNGVNNDFYIYGSPWHGDFSDYLESQIERAKLKAIFFLQKAEENSTIPISKNRSFKLLYPVIFPTFWDKEGTEMIVTFLSELLTKVSCFRLKFRKDRSVIGFVRKINCSSLTMKQCKEVKRCIKNQNLNQKSGG